MIKKLLSLVLLGGLLTWGPLFAETAESTNYKVLRSGFDSGGFELSHESYRTPYQSVGPVVNGVSSASSKQLVSGVHFSSYVRTLAGFDSLDTETITLNATVDGTLTSKVMFEVRLNGELAISISPQTIDSDVSDGFSLGWNSVQEVLASKDVQVVARAFDGLTWGPLFEDSSTFVVDNIFPTINSVAFLTDPFSPNSTSSIGVKDTSTANIAVVRDDFNWEVSIITRRIKGIKPQYQIRN